MPRPANILNPKADADRTLDTRLKIYAISITTFTLFFLYNDLKFEMEALKLPFNITIKGLTEDKFLSSLLFLNIIVWLRLGWRILISYGYNRYYDCAKEEAKIRFKNKKWTKKELETKTTDLYEEKFIPLKIIDKYFVGFIIPSLAGFLGIVILIQIIYNKLSFLYIAATLYSIVFLIVIAFKKLFFRKSSFLKWLLNLNKRYEIFGYISLLLFACSILTILCYLFLM